MGRQRKFRPPKVTTVVGQGTVITGDLRFEGGLHLEGRIQGNVAGAQECDATLTVSEQGVIEGDVKVENLILNGTVVGDVHACGRVELASNARVTGTVYYRMLEMAMGAEVNGKLVHSEDFDLTDGVAEVPREPIRAVGGGDSEPELGAPVKNASS